MRPTAELAEDFRFYARAGSMLGSKINERILTAAAADLERGGIVARLIEPFADRPLAAAIPLRFSGAAHRLVLEGRASDLAAHYPSVGGKPGPDLEETFLVTLETMAEGVAPLLNAPVQTNEVGRCAGLVGGFLLVAREFGLPLRILELGSSGGLNLNWDRYRYEARGATWGPPDSPVRLCAYNTQRVPPFDVSAEVVERSGCDAAPVDVTTEDGRLTLLSYVWPDQLHRFRNLRAAFQVADEFPPHVAATDAVPWLEEALSEPRPGVATVVFHSIFIQYVPKESRASLTELIEAAGAAATQAAPFAWLRLEPGGDAADVHLTTWPGDGDHLIARSGYHGDPVDWLAP